MILNLRLWLELTGKQAATHKFEIAVNYYINYYLFCCELYGKASFPKRFI